MNLNIEGSRPAKDSSPTSSFASSKKFDIPVVFGDTYVWNCYIHSGVKNFREL
jgi:hypothetical protein